MSNPAVPRNYFQVDCTGDKIRTKQSFKRETDINRIMEKYVKTGDVSPEALAQRQATFADVSEIGDFQQCQQQVIDAGRAFMTLPPDLRARFENEPAQLLDFVSQEENREEAIELGIIQKPEVEPEASVAPETPPETPPEGAA